MGYYDNQGYPNMYSGPANGGVCPMNNDTYWGDGESPLCATHIGNDGRVIRGHVEDYWIAVNNAGPDPYIVNGWIEHTQGDCTADFMGTSQSKFSKIDGATSFYMDASGNPLPDYTSCEPGDRDGCHGMKLFVNSRGYTVSANFSQYIHGYNGKTRGFTYSDFKAEIDAGRPVMIQLVGHAMIGYGYNDSGNTIYVHNTWDNSDHSMTWGGLYEGMQHTGVTVLRLQLPTVQFKSPTYSVAENGASVRVYVSRTGGSCGGVSVNYATANGTATAGSDYTAKSNTLSWANGDSADKYFDVPILNDTLFENDETFKATLSSATGATLGSPITVTTTIIDDDPLPVTINQAAGQGDPTNRSPINFSVVFSEPVVDFTNGVVAIAGSAPGSLVDSVTGSGTSYNVAVSGMTGSGTVMVSLPSNKVHDASGNPNIASTSSDNTVAYDVTPPNCAISCDGASPTNATSVQFSVDFSEDVVGFAQSDVNLAGTAPGTGITGFSGGPRNYTVVVGGIAGTGTVSMSVAAGACRDLAGNSNTAGGPVSFQIIDSPAQISVSPACLDFGTILVGTNADADISLQNLGGGTLGGTATLGSVSGPFSIVLNGAYGVATGVTQSVRVRYSPVTGGVSSNCVVFTGGGGATCYVVGAALGDGDSDHDGMSDWNEYLAGTSPSDSSSVFKVEGAVQVIGTGFEIRWSSVSNQVYTLERATNLLWGGFAPIVNSITATPPVNVQTDVVQNGFLGYFYRITTQR